MTPERRLALIEYQKGSLFHPYTCPYSHGDGASWVDHICLIPGEDEWFCAGQTCDYTQPYRTEDETMADFVIISLGNGDYLSAVNDDGSYS